VNFALFSEHAQSVELCLYDPGGKRETARYALLECTDHVWHGYLEGAGPGQLYGYRVHGPDQPDNGNRFNHHKLLMDPYAREIEGEFRWHSSHFGHDFKQSGQNLVLETQDSGPRMLKARVTHESFDWGDDHPPAIPWTDTVIYEIHVRGFTKQHPDVPEALRGTYAGLASDASISYLRKLGITSVELLPIHYHIDEGALNERGLVNYWGYNTLGFFAPDRRLHSGAGGASVSTEFRSMVRTLHAAGIEVILDVVYNHTCEGDERGPTLCFRGIDNKSYYRLRAGHERMYENFTGCGNSLNLAHPRVLQMVMDSMRYWVQEMHVDGFRFDLATTLGREHHGFDSGSGFFDAVCQDPVLSRVKLISEPWDVGYGGYQVGHFPPGWHEWNDRYRDMTREFWLHRGAAMGEMARRLTASSDIFRRHGRRPQAGINFITAHDGFTLVDLVSYGQKHNHANGEENRDGTSDNRSWNCGAEGPTDDPIVKATRRKLQRTLLASLFVSQGVPMLLGGDELGRTQNGNNNAYCQDNRINWFDWGARDRDLLRFVRHLIAVRKRLPALRRNRWFEGKAPDGRRDIVWLAPDGAEMTDPQWWDRSRHCFGFLMPAEEPRHDNVLILLNADPAHLWFALPPGSWQALIDTARDAPDEFGAPVTASFLVQARSLALLTQGQSSGGS
jgi:glycogen operon protein